MAEFVQQSMEAMLPELEQIQRVQLMTKEEVKSIVKRRQRFEYSLQKQTKRKEDFLSYIQYEMAILSLVEVRREKIGYVHKKEDIDYSIARRINKLYRILEQRFGDDVKIWMSHIDFLKRMSWVESVGKVFRGLLQKHVYDTSLWIAAAKYELEEAGNAESARKILFEGMRFNKKSQELMREYFRFELLYVDGLRKRSQVLGIEKDGGSKKKEEESKDDDDDGVLQGAIARKVFQQASKDFPSASFICSLLSVALEFDFCQGRPREQQRSITEEIEAHLEETYPDCPCTWDALARSSLRRPPPADKTTTTLSVLESCFAKYERGLEVLVTKADQLLDLYVQTLLEVTQMLSSSEEQLGLRTWTAAKLVQALEQADQRGILGEKHYKDWVSVSIILSLFFACF